MRIITITILAVLLSSLNLNGQTRSIYGRVISEYLEPLPGVYIENSDNVLLGETDMHGQFRISIPQETDSLLFRFVGMEWTDIRLKKDCDTVEVVMIYDGTYNFMSFKKIDRIRKKRFDELLNIHSDALDKGLFTTKTICYEREFEPDKPKLDAVRKKLKELSKTNKSDFKDLSIGDSVKIPFGIDSSKKRVRTTYATCRNCTEEDYDYLIEGEIINKRRKKLTLEIKITEMQPYGSLEFRGKILIVGSDFKYEMKYFEVIID
ncbi:hypothetical protein [Draconibacterium sediminis]|nr:hypothetical protein [Draconibacterium sediminis]